jgi:putative ABC transport system substrate-binding protein
VKRRQFITFIAGATAWPVVAQAQPSHVRPLIGLLSPLSAASASRNVTALRSALRELGYVDGRNMTLALRYGNGATSRLSCKRAGKTRTLMPVSDSSGESRIRGLLH